jgi:hypothetical protein
MAYFQSLSWGTDDFGNLQELDKQVFEQQLAENLGKWPLITLNLCAFSL